MGKTQSNRLKRVLVGIGELAISLALVGFFFMIFFGIYSLSFPDATGLGDLIRTARTTQGDLDFEMEGLVEDTSFSAMLSQIQNKVKEKPANGIVWGRASAGIRLGDRHAVQSLARSGATISFDDESQLRLGENSLVVIRETRRAARSGRRTASVVMLSGELSGQVSPSDEAPLVVEIVGATSTLRVDSSSNQTTAFKVTTNADDSSTFSVHDGEAFVDSAGRMIKFGPNQFVTIDSEGRIQRAVPLPPVPTAVSPGDGSRLTFRGVAPLVGFAWESLGADSYRFSLARDADFQDVVHEVVTADAHFQHGGLIPGNYFWRVSSLDGPAESAASPARKFEILRDGKAPPLQVHFPDAPIETAMLSLSGETEPGAEIFVGDTRIDPDENGWFTHQVRLFPGINVVVVEAVDPVGNTSYASSAVHSKFVAPESMP